MSGRVIVYTNSRPVLANNKLIVDTKIMSIVTPTNLSRPLNFATRSYVRIGCQNQDPTCQLLIGQTLMCQMEPIYLKYLGTITFQSQIKKFKLHS